MEFYIDLKLVCTVLDRMSMNHWKRFEETRDRGELNNAILYGRIALGIYPRELPDFHGMFLGRLGVFLLERFKQYGRIEDLWESIELNRAALKAHPDGHPDRPVSLNGLANSICTRFKQYGRTADLDEAIELHRVSLQLQPNGHPNRFASLNNLAGCLARRFEQRGQTADLDETIELGRAALRLHPKDHPGRFAPLITLAHSLGTRFEQHRQTADLDEAIALSRAGVQFCPDGHPARSESLHNLASSLRTRFEYYGRTTDLDEAVELHRAALQLRPDSHPYRSSSLNNLASTLRIRFEHYQQTADLEEAIKLHRAALRLHPDGHLDRSASLNNLASSLHTRFQQQRQAADLNEAIELNCAAVQLLPDGHPERSTSLNNLAISLWTRFEQYRKSADLDDAIKYYHTALQLRPDGHPDHSTSLNNLATSLANRFEQHGQIADLNEAIKLLRAAMQLHPIDHPDRFMFLDNLANSLARRFEQHGQIADLDEAIELHRAALQLHPIGHPNRSACLNNLANSLARRFEQHGQTVDFEEAIELHSAALQLRPHGHPNRSTSLNSLANSLQIRFRQYGQSADLDEAVKLYRAALQLLPDGHPNRSTSLNNLANSLRTRFEQHGQTVDLDEAMELHHAALQLHPDGHPGRSASLSNLANSLAIRFEHRGQTADLDEAVELHRASLNLRPNGHPEHSAALANLATSLLSRFTKFGRKVDFEECMKSLECAVEHEFSSLVVRLEIAGQWTKFARNHSHHTTSKAYKAAMLLLQRVLIISPTLHAQYDFLSRKGNSATLTSDAVAHAVEENRLEEAIEILEQGRGLLWSQMRGFRAPLDDLARTNIGLAGRFMNVSRQLENLVTSSSALWYSSGTAGSRLSALDVHGERILSEERLKLKRKLSNEQEELIKEIQQIPGFESFLTATPFRELWRVASEGPVIVVNHSEYRSDVLITLSREDLPVVCVPLDGEFDKDIVTLCEELLETRESRKVFSPQYDEVLRRVMRMLWDRVVSKVVRKLKELGVTEGSRIWWCPTSMLSALPFHAAGPFEDADGTVKYLLDDYVSSYTPTLGALINARLRGNASNPKMLIVGDTKTLKSTKAEIRAVRNNTGNYVSSYAIHINKEALRNTVIKGLQDITWIHFACHGLLASGSLDSSFKLWDGGLTLLDIIRANLPNAEFAFLSACHTAEQDIFGADDETLHLAAAVQFCGFQSVIGTMWEMYDPDGPLLAREVYSYMGDYEDGEVIHKRSAAALRHAVSVLRRRDGVTTERWVNLVHIGA